MLKAMGRVAGNNFNDFSARHNSSRCNVFVVWYTCSVYNTNSDLGDKNYLYSQTYTSRNRCASFCIGINIF